MADHPILFSAPMIRAILREIEQPGTGKTQTRRVLKGAWQSALEGHDEVITWFAPPNVPRDGIVNEWAQSGIWARKRGPRGYNRHLGYVPYRPGDRLWVREAWSGHHVFRDISPANRRSFTTPDGPYLRKDIWFWANGNPDGGDYERPRPSIHMPRWASRLTIYVTDVRVERLQDISEADAVAEGIERDHAVGMMGVFGWRDYLRGSEIAKRHFSDPRESYRTLWDAINGPGAWEANPWIVAYTFVPRLGNIDARSAQLAEAA